MRCFSSFPEFFFVLYDQRHNIALKQSWEMSRVIWSLSDFTKHRNWCRSQVWWSIVSCAESCSLPLIVTERRDADYCSRVVTWIVDFIWSVSDFRATMKCGLLLWGNHVMVRCWGLLICNWYLNLQEWSKKWNKKCRHYLLCSHVVVIWVSFDLRLILLESTMKCRSLQVWTANSKGIM